MGSKLQPEQKELQRRTDEVLHYVWDPIRVSTIPEARDEYSGYVLQILGLLVSKASAEKIAARLTEIATEQMGLSANPANDLKVAELLVQWRDAINDKGA